MAKEFPAPPELERRLQALDRAVEAPDLPAVMRARGVNMARVFEHEDIENIDICHWSIDGMSFRGARVVDVRMTSEQALLIRQTGPREFHPIVELMVDEAEYTPSPAEGETVLSDPWEEALRRIDRAKRFHLLNLDLEGLKLNRLPEEIKDLGFLLSLNLRGTGISDLAPLAGMTEMTTLNLSGKGITDLAPLAGMTAMTSLTLQGTGISDLAPLAGMTAMISLTLQGTGISDLAPLAGMTAVT
uniref:leucine-rich repeat domain-containing protein n=1 Tax=Roseovarius sp. TaxID=1486281 RepID=UPI00356186CF